jgi:hypothetical protein
MKPFVLLPAVFVWAFTASPSHADTLVLEDGRRIVVRRYEIRGRLVVFTSNDGGLFSLPVDYLDLEATRGTNRDSTRTNAVPAPEAAGSRHLGTPSDAVSPPRSSDAMNQQAKTMPGPADAVSEATVQETLSLVGIVDLLDQIPEEAAFLAEQVANLRPGTDASERAFFRRSAKLAFATPSIGPAVADSFQRRTREPSLRMGIEFLRSLPWRTFRELVRRARTPEGVRELQAFQMSLKDEPASERERQLAERFDEALALSRMHVEFRMEILTALVEGFRLAPSELEATNEAGPWIESARSVFIENAREAALLTALFGYRSLDDEDLSECLEFWESDVGRSLRNSTEDSLLAGIRVGAARLNLLLAGSSWSDHPLLVADDP